MSPSSKDRRGSSSSSPDRRWRDEEHGSFGELSNEEDDTFTIPPKKATLEQHRKWRHATLVLNAARRFRYTVDLKKVEEKEEIRRKIRMHAQVIRAALLFKEAGEKQLHDQTQKAQVDAPIPTIQPAATTDQTQQAQGHQLNAPSDGQSSPKEVQIAIWGSSLTAAIVITLATHLGSKDTIPNQEHAFLPFLVILMSLISYIFGVLILIRYIHGSRDMPKVARILTLGCLVSATIGVLLGAAFCIQTLVVSR